MLVCACVFVLARLCAPCTCTEKQEINWGKRKSDTPYAESDCAFYSNAVWQRAHLLHKRLWRKVHFSRTVKVPAHEIVLGSVRAEKCWTNDSRYSWLMLYRINIGQLEFGKRFSLQLSEGLLYIQWIYRMLQAKLIQMLTCRAKIALQYGVWSSQSDTQTILSGFPSIRYFQISHFKDVRGHAKGKARLKSQTILHGLTACLILCMTECVWATLFISQPHSCLYFYRLFRLQIRIMY